MTTQSNKPEDDLGQLNYNACSKHQDINVYGGYGQRGCVECVFISKLIKSQQLQLIERLEGYAEPAQLTHFKVGDVIDKKVIKAIPLSALDKIKDSL